jgi:hypothetical protein
VSSSADSLTLSLCKKNLNFFLQVESSVLECVVVVRHESLFLFSSVSVEWKRSLYRVRENENGLMCADQ